MTARPERIERIEIPMASVASAWITCVLHGPGGAPERVLFDLLRTAADGATFHARREATGEGGHFRIGPLLPGTHSLVASTPTLGTLPLGEVAVAAGAEVDGGVHAFLAPATIALLLVGPDGRPAAIGQLDLFREGLPGALLLPLVGGAGRRELQPGGWHASYLGLAGRPIFEEAMQFDWFDGTGVRAFAERRAIGAEGDRSWRACLAPSSYRVVVRDALGREAATEFVVDDRATSDEIVEIRLPAARSPAAAPLDRGR